MSATRTRKDPLLPVDFVVTGLLGLVIVGCLVTGGLAAFGPGNAASTVCATEQHTAVDVSVGQRAYVIGAAPGARVLATAAQICTDQPSVAMHAWDVLTWLPIGAFFVGTLLLARRLVRLARRAGPFDSAVVGGIGRLGIYLITGGLIATFVQALAKARLLELLTPGALDDRWLGLPNWLGQAHLHLAVLLTGIALVSVARIVRLGSGMRRELDATI